MRILKIVFYSVLGIILSACGGNEQQASNSTLSEIESSTSSTADDQTTSSRQITTSTTQESFSENLFTNLASRTVEDTPTTKTESNTTSKPSTTAKPEKTVYEMAKPTECLLTSTEGSTEDFVSRLSMNCLYRPNFDGAENTWINLIETNVHSKVFVRDSGFYKSPEASCIRGSNAASCLENDGSFDLEDDQAVTCNFDEVTVKTDRMANRLRGLCGSSLKITIQK